MNPSAGPPKTDDRDVEQLLRIQRDGASQDWWTPFRSTMPSGMPRFVGIETAARETWAFHPALVLGLLQTEAYARALYELAKPIEETTTEFIDKNIQVRLRRNVEFTVGAKLGDATQPPCDNTGGQDEAEESRTTETAYEVDGISPKVAIAVGDTAGDAKFVAVYSGTEPPPEVKKLIAGS
ncbi:DUF6281 family protein [Streptomyces sp. NPDC006356]